MSPAIRTTVSAMPRSGIREIMDLAWATPGVIHLEVGEPDFPTPTHIGEAAQQAIEDRKVRYTPNAGIVDLREAMAHKVTTRNGIAVSPDQIVVGAGAVEAIYASLVCTLAPGDEILLPDPGWPNFTMMATLLSAQPVYYPLRAANGFMPDAAEIERLITPRTKVILINSPSNPLGVVMDESSVVSLYELARRHDLWIVSDECYDEITFDQPQFSPGQIDTDGRVISTFSMSKTYAMTGWRVGYAAIPLELASVLAKTQEPLISCVSSPAQFAAIAALTGPQDCVSEMRDAYRARRDAAVDVAADRGIPFVTPQGAFYLWLDVSATGVTAREFALSLIRERGVAVAPGTAFGAEGEGWIRISLANSRDAVVGGVDAVAALMSQTSAQVQ
jgi:aspartate/methionine/tyrosine aminotransferase